MRLSLPRRPAPFEYNEILPEGIRNALSHNGARLNRDHIEKGLLAQDQLKNLGFYLLMKATEDEDQLQMGLLDSIAETNYRFPGLDREDVRVQSALDYLDSQPEPFVHGGKLAQVSRHGFSNWVDHFDRALRPKMDTDNPPELFVVANASYVGLDRIASLSVMRGRLLRILKPGRFDSPERSVGFTLKPVGDSVDTSPLDPSFERPEEAIVFDDVTARGAVKSQIMDFWGESARPEFTAAITVGKAF